MILRPGRPLVQVWQRCENDFSLLVLKDDVCQTSSQDVERRVRT